MIMSMGLALFAAGVVLYVVGGRQRPRHRALPSRLVPCQTTMAWLAAPIGGSVAPPAPRDCKARRLARVPMSTRVRLRQLSHGGVAVSPMSFSVTGVRSCSGLCERGVVG